MAGTASGSRLSLELPARPSGTRSPRAAVLSSARATAGRLSLDRARPVLDAGGRRLQSLARAGALPSVDGARSQPQSPRSRVGGNASATAKLVAPVRVVPLAK